MKINSKKSGFLGLVLKTDGKYQPGFIMTVTVLWLLAGVGVAIALSKSFSNDQKPYEVLSISPAELIEPDDLARSHNAAPYTLIQVIDYECPACQAAEPLLQHFLNSNQELVRIYYKNFPLNDIHPNAWDASAVALGAEEQGRFEEMHRYLLLTKYEQEEVITEARRLGLDIDQMRAYIEANAPEKINQDMALMRSLKIDGTPTFILISPDDRVRRFNSFDLAKSYINDDAEKRGYIAQASD